MIRKRLQTVAALAVLVALVLTAIAPATSARAAGKVLRYQQGGEPATIDPQVANYTDQVAYAHALFATLLRYDKSNQPEPYVAKEVPTVANGGISKDGLTYTYKLRTDWKWSDGKGVVKAGDVVYAFQRLVDPKSAAGYGAFLNGLLLNADKINNGDEKDLTKLGVKALDDATVQFTLVHAAGYFNQIACLWFSAPVRKDNVERAGLPSPDAWTDPAYGPVVGTGAFTLSKWDHNKEIDFVKNPNYGGTPAKLDEIDQPIITDQAVSYAGYKSGELDIATFPTAEYKNILADPVLGKQLLKYNNSCSFYFAFDNSKPPFDDINVRKAFSYAINRDLYVHVVSQDIATKQLSFLPDGVIPNFDPKTGAEYDYNPDKAVAALKASKYPDPATFPTVNFNYSAGANGQRRADFMKAQIQKVLGINLTENPMDGAVYEQATSDPLNKLSGMELAGWCSDYLHPSDWMYPVFGSNGKNGNALNLAGFNSPAFDAAAQAADNETDPVKALALYTKAQQVLIDNVPVAFLENTVSIDLVNPKVSGLNPNSLDGGIPGSFFWEDIDIAS